MRTRPFLPRAGRRASQTQEGRLLGDYTSACVAAASFSDGGPIDDLLARIDAAQPGPSLAATIAALHDAGVGVLFSFGAARDPMKPGSMIANAGEGGIGLPDRSYYVDAPAQTVLPAYRAHIAALTQLVGIADPALADAVVRVETALAGAMLTQDQRRDPLALYHVETLATLTQALPHFDLATYLVAEQAPTFESLNVTVPPFFDALDMVLAQTSLADLKRYLRWRVVEAYAFALDDTVIAEEYRFHAGTFQGFTQPLPRNEYCLRSTVRALSWSVSALYVQRYAGDVALRAQPLVDRIRQALADDLAGVGWLDDATRAAALEKLGALRDRVSAPDDFSAYETDVTSLPPGFASSYERLYQHGRARSLQRIGTVDERAWFMSPIAVNAAYSPSLNAINLPAAILQAPLFDAKFPDLVSYGGIGTVIGHELTHAFDDQGRKHDGAGALADWWTPAVKAQFDARAQCLVDQYGAIEAAPGVHIDGMLTLGENIADVAGVKLAHAALHPTGARWADFTDAQLFFLAYAQGWCTSIRPEALATQLRTDPHAPASARVNAVLADTPEFAAAFSCPTGAPLAPATRCSVW